MIHFDVFEKLEGVPSEHRAYDMVWVDDRYGDYVRCRLCFRQFNAEQRCVGTCAGTPETLFMRYLISTAASELDWRVFIMDFGVAVVHT